MTFNPAKAVPDKISVKKRYVIENLSTSCCALDQNGSSPRVKKLAYETTKFTVNQDASCSRSNLPVSSPGSIRDSLSRRTHPDHSNQKRTIAGLATEKTSTRNGQSFRSLARAPNPIIKLALVKPKPKISVKNYMSDKIGNGRLGLIRG